MIIRDKVINIINQQLENCNLVNDENYILKEIGVNSINFIQIIVFLEKEFQIEFDDDALDNEKFQFLNELCDYISKKLTRD